MNKSVALLAVLAFATILTGCAGYRLGSDKPTALANVRKIAVPTFKNDTLEPRLEVMVTNAVIKKLQADGTFKVVPRSEADAVLTGKIIELTSNQFRAVRQNTLRSSELLIGIRLSYEVEDTNGNRLTGGQAQGASNIIVDPSFQIGERAGFSDAAERLSTSLVSTLTEGW